MKRYLLYIAYAILLLMFYNNSDAQNLVPNPGFELYNDCPDDLGDIDYSPGYTSFSHIQGWVRPSGGTSDCFHACGTYPANMPNTRFGFHHARTGGGMAGLYGYQQRYPSLDLYCEYLQCKLNSKLAAGTRYTVEFYVYFLKGKMADDIWTVDKIGVNISDTQYYNMPQYGHIKLPYSVSSPANVYLDKANVWVRVKGDFIANGNEQWLTLGVFDEGTPKNIKQVSGSFDSTADAKCYFMIDDVYLGVAEPCDTTNKLIDTNVCREVYENVQLKATKSGDTYLWNTGSANNAIIIPAPGLYWCKIVDGCRIHTDTFKVNGYKEEFHSDSIISCTGIEFAESRLVNAKYIWNTGDTTQSISTNGYETYWCNAKKGCTSRTDSFHILYKQRMAAIHHIDDTTICKGEKMSAGQLRGDAKKYLWNTGENTCCITITEPGIYTITIYDDCQELSDTFVVADKECNDCLILPTAFTPNRDGLNDELGPVVLCPVTGYLFNIYNRRGNLVFSSNNPGEKWDGNYRNMPAAADVYNYMLQFTSNNNKNKELRKGNVTLVR